MMLRADSKKPDLYEDQLKENYDKEVIEGVGTSKEQYELERLREFVDEFYEICTRPELIDENLQFTFLFCQADFHEYDRNPTREGLVWLLYYCKTIIIQDPKCRTESGLGLVDLAIERSSSRVLETLLSEGADPHYHNSDHITPLARAIRKDDQKKIFLISKYMNMQPKSAPSLIIDSKPETQAAVTESKKLIPGQFEIDMSITLSQCKKDFDEISRQYRALSSSIIMSLNEIYEDQEAICWWQMAYHALPVLDLWSKNHQEAHPEVADYQTKTVNKREILFAYLKTAITAQVNATAGTGKALPSNLAPKAFEFLLGLSEAMVKNQATAANNDDRWAARFFGDPWNGQNPRGLAQMELIRQHASSILKRNENGAWAFIHPKMRDTLSSAMIVEFTYISSRKQADGMDRSETTKESLKELAETLMNAPQGTMTYRNYGTVLAQEPSSLSNWRESGARAQAIAQLKEKLTQEEIKTLSKYLAEIVELETSIQNKLINTIQNGRISAEDDSDFVSGTRDSNYFAENLKALLDNGAILEEFAKMSQKDQDGFALKANFIGLLLKNGIDFDVLTYLSASDLVSFENFLTTAQNISKYELLHSKDFSPEKARAIEFVTSELNSRAQMARKLKN